jgi:hypothetical protein
MSVFLLLSKEKFLFLFSRGELEHLIRSESGPRMSSKILLRSEVIARTASGCGVCARCTPRRFCSSEVLANLGVVVLSGVCVWLAGQSGGKCMIAVDVVYVGCGREE